MNDPWLLPRTAYLHVPFCAHHCGYCDFAVTAGQDHLIDLYLEALGTELAGVGEPRPVESLFIGGGTPTHLSADQLKRLLEVVRNWLPLRRSEGDGTPPCEFSIEANPDSLTEEKAAVLAAFGVTRVSIGVQSFAHESLAALDRRHQPDHIGRAVDAVRGHISTVSFDLIFGAPGAALAGWQADLESALAFGPQHLSTYGLTYEKGTPLWKRQTRGLVTALSEDAELAMYEHAMDRLTATGFEHYEISNFARPGFRCRHNERYWANEAYYGFGVGAARYVNGVRALNVRDTKLYIRRALSGEDVTFQREELPPRARAFETLATQLRRADGIERAAFHTQTGFALDELAPVALGVLRDNGIVTDGGTFVRLTRRGKCVADAAVAEVLKES
ncbi:MAG TPA: radical SAM family heme chaperone HemW [Gemmata sp.]